MYLFVLQVIMSAVRVSLDQEVGLNAALLSRIDAAEAFAEERYAGLVECAGKISWWVNVLLQVLGWSLTVSGAYLNAQRSERGGSVE